MADWKVQVALPPKGVGGNSIKVDHAASDIKVQEGHLLVLNGGDRVAIYAPGKWDSAVVSKGE